ncbi:hypothetical protein D9M68_731180 [compost metagenome]
MGLGAPDAAEALEAPTTEPARATRRGTSAAVRRDTGPTGALRLQGLLVCRARLGPRTSARCPRVGVRRAGQLAHRHRGGLPPDVWRTGPLGVRITARRRLGVARGGRPAVSRRVPGGPPRRHRAGLRRDLHAPEGPLRRSAILWQPPCRRLRHLGARTPRRARAAVQLCGQQRRGLCQRGRPERRGSRAGLRRAQRAVTGRCA